MKKIKFMCAFLLLATGWSLNALISENIAAEEQNAAVTAETETAAETDANAETAAETDANAETAAETDANAETAAETDANAETAAETDANAETAAETDANAETAAETDANAETAAETDANAETETDVNAGAAEVQESSPMGDEEKTGFAGLEKKLLSAWELTVRGGVLMIPIGFMSILVIAIGLERLLALRRGAVLPKRLLRNVESQIISKADPRAIYAHCCRNRSALSRVMQAALFKSGRPMNEVQSALESAKENEANRLYAPVRLLVLAAAVTPLIGLLGTVVGMIEAFMATASSVGVHKAEMLSQGIYTALVTTCAGLAVAIPAAILAHWYEGKIQKLFYQMDQKLVNFTTYIEGLEGKTRLTPTHFQNYVKQKNQK
ncbi:MAG: MotA/TolQ/ExbB proton channel family protein [Thermoguttaceae bacterium]|nr:MotA/TolQ/ExbB proton channel family protein [Thermoguttaceae bacterium]